MTFDGDDRPDEVFADMDGRLYVSIWNGSRVSVYGGGSFEKIGDIIIPSAHATACCVGGANREYLYITSAKARKDDSAPAGGLFRIHT